MIEVLALGGREGLMDARPSNGELHVLTNSLACSLCALSFQRALGERKREE
jgi:hypothetical protein